MIRQRNRENFCLEVINIFNLLISVGILIWYLSAGGQHINLILTIQTGVETVYLVVWSFALCSLFARFKSSEHLLPRKRVFIIHATLLTVYLLCQIVSIVMTTILYGGTCEGTCFDVLASINNIALTFENATEVTTFAYVVYS